MPLRRQTVTREAATVTKVLLALEFLYRGAAGSTEKVALFPGAVTSGWAWQYIFWLNVPIGLVLMPLSSLQELLHLAPGRIHEVGIKLYDITEATAVAAALRLTADDYHALAVAAARGNAGGYRAASSSLNRAAQALNSALIRLSGQGYQVI